MQGAVTAALADGAKLIEVEFPTSGLSTVAGDGMFMSQQCHKTHTHTHTRYCVHHTPYHHPIHITTQVRVPMR